MNTSTHPRLILSALLLLIVAATNVVMGQGKKALDHDAYDIWNRITAPAISVDGHWTMWTLGPVEKDSKLQIHDGQGEINFEIDRTQGARFSPGSDFVAFKIVAAKDSVRQAKLDKVKKDDMPKDSLGILNLSSGSISRMDRVMSFKMPEDAGGWIAYRLEKALKEDSEDAEPDSSAAEPKEEEEEEDDEKDKTDGTTLVVRNLSSGEESRFEFVTDYEFSKNGNWLVFVRSEESGESDGIYALRLGEPDAAGIMTGEGDYKQIAIDEDGRQLAFISDRDDYEADQPAYSVYHIRLGDDDARMLATEGNAAFPLGWWISEHEDLSFSDSGERLFFGTAPRPEPEPDDDDVLEEEKVKVDIWSWKDPLLQPMQLLQADAEKKRAYVAVAFLDSGDLVQLETESVPQITFSAKGDGAVALGMSNLPYRQQISWDSPRYYDGYIVDVVTGEKTKVLEAVQTSDAGISPEGKYVYWWDGIELAWMTLSTSTQEVVEASRGIPYPVFYELHDWPYLTRSNGSAGWTEGDESFLIYDTYDIWALDPSGEELPRSITESDGRDRNLRFRIVDLDFEEPAIDPDADLLLSVLDKDSKDAGFYRDRFSGDRTPEALVVSNHSFGSVRKAKDADRLLFTRQNFQEFPDVWTGDLDFDNMLKLSDANPQQKDYLWGTSELVSWTSLDGQPLRGILYKPEGFDPSEKYPMMVYFYEKNTDNLNRHRTPGAGSSSIDFSFYVSRGYLLFVPDIPYKIGYPGESAMNAIMPGVTSLIDAGFVDAERIGVQGHSWGGYQIAYMVTQTNLFAAAEAGAPVSNMTSAYGGIRWGSGMSRAFQYEKTQSRIGGTLWDATLKYIHNSPLFQAPKVETPLLMMHNDEDGAVPWYQGIEFFSALRRLGKKTWMLNYNGEAHGLRKDHNRRDWAIRMQQFFDHYLKDAPAPVWLQDGVPAIKKGLTLGLEEAGNCGCGGG